MIKNLIMDVDGSLTDSKIYMGNDGEVAKAFSIKDGYAINHILRNANIEPIVITARESQIVLNRCKELGISKIYQGKENKLQVLQEITPRIFFEECAYFGDDVLDLKCMNPIKDAGGIVGCPADAVKEVKAIADYICIEKAGEGALREFAEWLICTENNVNTDLIDAKINKAIQYIDALDKERIEVGKYVVSDDFYYMVQEYETKNTDTCRLESHRKYVDIQWIVRGEEIIEIASIIGLHIEENYNEDKDIMFWSKRKNMMRCVLRKNSYVVLYPENAHTPSIAVDNPILVKKIVGKILI